MPENNKFNTPPQGYQRPQAASVFAELLQEENAPHGPLASDLKSALYVCAATKHYTFEEAVSDRKMLLLGMMLASVGFEGDTSSITHEDVMKVLQELLDCGALEYVGSGAGFVAPHFKTDSVGKVRCVIVSHTDSFVNGSTTELRFSDNFGEYPLYSKFLVVPGDEVSVVINHCTGLAYVKAITNKRAMLIGEASYNNEIYFRERGFNAFDVRLTKDGIPFKSGDLVVTEIVGRKGSNILIVRAREVIQNTGALNSFIFKAVLDHNLPNTWPEAVQYQVKSIPEKVEESETKGRIDLRNIPLVTIDGEDARDFDDAVYCQKEDDKFHLIVAIADVSYYVRSGSAIDNEALARCTSVYFPYYVIPMLPVELSNGICSLNPNVDRLCMVCDMIINQKGNIERYGFYPAVMKSHARLTYTEAHHMITEGEAIKSEHKQCVPWIKNLYEVYQALRKARDARGVFEFESTEVHFLFDQNWKISGMEPDDHNEAHELIEECMIAANICAATFVKTNKYDSLYRIHDRPDPERLEKLRAILSRYGIDLRGGDNPTPRDFRLVSEQVEKLPEGVHQIIALQMLRSMMKACYSPDNIGHFGLALENYSHFTSPIRRYPDLQIHRVIKFILEKQKKRSWGKIGSRFYSHEELVNLGIKCSDREVAAADAEYDVSNSLKCEYVKNFLNEVVQGTVSTVDKWGVFVTLNDFFIDGRIKPYNAYFYIDADRHCFSDSSGKTCYVGDQILVRIVNVNSMARMIELQPVSNKRKADNSFDLKGRMESLKSQAVSDPQPNNEDKALFFSKLADISLGKQADSTDNITRPQRDYSIASELDLSTAKHMGETAMGKALAAAQEQAQEQEEQAQAQAQADSSVTDAKPATKAAKKSKKAAAKTTDEASAAAAQSTSTEASVPNEEKKPKAKAKSKSKQSTAAAAQHVSPTVEKLLDEAPSNIDADLTGSKYPKTDKKKPKATKAIAADTQVAVSAVTNEEAASEDKSSASVEVKAETKVKAKAKAKGTKSNAKSVQEAELPQTQTHQGAEPQDNPAEGTEMTTNSPEILDAKVKAKDADGDEVKSAPKVKASATKAAAKKAPAKKAAAKAEPAAADKPAADKPAADKPAAETKAPAKKAAAKKATAKAEPAAADKPAADKPAAEAKAPAKKAAAKKATAKAEPAAADKQAAETKAPAKKAAAKKSTAKAEPAAADKPAAEANTPAKKAAAKKATAKAEPAAAADKPAAEAKTPAKKAAAKKATAKAEPAAAADKPAAEAKTPAKKAAAKKATAKAEPAAAADKPAAEAKAPAKKAAAKKATAKAEPAAAADKPAAEAKAPAKKATAKKATAKTEPAVADKPAAEAKAPAKKAAAKKTAAKAEPAAADKPAAEAKAPAKKAAAKKTAAKAEPAAADKPAAEAKAPAKKAAAKKTTAKAEPAAADKPAAEAKAPAKKAAAKKTAAKAEPATADKPAAEAKAPAKKAAAKKTTAKAEPAAAEKPAAEAKAPAKKAAAKKATAKAEPAAAEAPAAEAKAPAKKAPAKKAAAKKTAAKKTGTKAE